MQDSLDLEILMGAPTVAENTQKALLNQYGTIVVTDAKNQDGRPGVLRLGCLA